MMKHQELYVSKIKHGRQIKKFWGIRSVDISGGRQCEPSIRNGALWAQFVIRILGPLQQAFPYFAFL